MLHGVCVVECMMMSKTVSERKRSDMKRHAQVAQQGVSLVEGVVVVAIIGVIVGIMYPSFERVFASMEARRVKLSLIQAHRQARGHSYLTKSQVLVCLADNEKRCHRQAQQMVLVFVDNNHNHRFDENMDVILLEESLSLRYGYVQTRASLHRHYFKYFGDTGMPRGHFGHVSYCHLATNQGYQVVVNHVGGVRVGEGC